MQEIEYNDQLLTALRLLEEGQSPLFITGNAGTGKSALLTLFLQNTKKNAVVLAPTGVAALNVKGVTIHSFFGFKPGISIEKAREKGRKVKETSPLFSVDLIVIDEISMVRADLLDCIDAFLRAAFSKNEPFGGMRMVFIGDLYQLPPVLQSEEKPFFEKIYESPYFFSSQVMKEAQFERLELQKIYRQREASFIEVLNAIRKNCATDEQLAFLNQRVIVLGEGEDRGFIHLTATNRDADQINEEKLRELPGKLHSFTAETEGEFEASHAPTDHELKIKEGSQVMLLSNHPEGLWVNGTVGTVARVQEEKILIVKREGGTISVERHKWTLFKYRFDEQASRLIHDEIGSFTQYPLRLAWSITIHKSQGKTFDRAVVDLSRSFAPGQAYVALSRCSSFEGLILKNPVKKSQIRTDQHVVRFFHGY